MYFNIIYDKYSKITPFTIVDNIKFIIITKLNIFYGVLQLNLLLIKKSFFSLDKYIKFEYYYIALKYLFFSNRENIL